MISFYAKYLLYTLKKQLRKPSIWILILLFPICTYCFSFFSKGSEDDLKVSLYCEDSNELCSLVIDKLLERDGIFVFEKASSEEEVRSLVASGKAECGYIFDSKLLTNFRNGITTKQIKVVTSSSTTMSKIVDEIVYAELYEEYVYQILMDYLETKSPLTNLNPSEVMDLYRENLRGGGTFTFTYEGAFQTYQAVKEGLSKGVILGFLAIFMLLSGISGIISYSNNLDDKIYVNLTRTRRFPILLCEIVSPVLLTLLPAALCLHTLSYFTSGMYVLRFMLYALMIIVFCFLLFLILRKKMTILSILPFYLIGCMVFTPMFIDVTLFIPAFKPICYLFLPFYLI